MGEGKVVGRSVAIALGIICVILAVSLIGTFANYTSIINGKDKTITSLNSQIDSLNSQITSLQDQLSERDKTINSLKSQIANLQNQISDLNSQIASLKSENEALKKQISELQNRINELNSIINLNKYEVWVSRQTVSQPAGYVTSWYNSTNYAGYIVVTVHSSTTDKTVVYVKWSSYGINYYNEVNVGVSGTAVFPVLPASYVEVGVGNRNLFNGATETVTIIYYY